MSNPIKAKDAVSELVSYQEFENLPTEEKLNKLYRAVHVTLRLALDMRKNQVMLSEGKEIKTSHNTKQKKPDNPVIKDDIEVK